MRYAPTDVFGRAQDDERRDVSIADIAFYLLLAATVGWIWWRDRERMRRIADYLGED